MLTLFQFLKVEYFDVNDLYSYLPEQICWVSGGDGGMQPGSCPNRGESRPMNDANKSLVLQNYFRDDPNENLSCVDNSANLENMLDVCYKASGNRWTNFLAVDFYKVCHLLCSCSSRFQCCSVKIGFRKSTCCHTEMYW